MSNFSNSAPNGNMPPTHLVTLRVLSDRNATVAQAAHCGLIATGSSKRDKGDHYDPEIGTRLAVARALKNLARELEKALNV